MMVNFFLGDDEREYFTKNSVGKHADLTFQINLKTIDSVDLIHRENEVTGFHQSLKNEENNKLYTIAKFEYDNRNWCEFSIGNQSIQLDSEFVYSIYGKIINHKELNESHESLYLILSDYTMKLIDVNWKYLLTSEDKIQYNNNNYILDFGVVPSLIQSITPLKHNGEEAIETYVEAKFEWGELCFIDENQKIPQHSVGKLCHLMFDIEFIPGFTTIELLKQDRIPVGITISKSNKFGGLNTIYASYLRENKGHHGIYSLFTIDTDLSDTSLVRFKGEGQSQS